MKNIILLKKAVVVFIAIVSVMMTATSVAVFVVAPLHQKWLEYNYDQNYKRVTKIQSDLDEVMLLLSRIEKLYREQKLP